MSDVRRTAAHREGWSSDHVAWMKDAWITTAEQVVALSATDSGLESIGEQLRVSTDEARWLVDLARQTLSAETRAEMDQPAGHTLSCRLVYAHHPITHRLRE